MTFMDKVGSAFSKTGHGIGSAWTAATDNAVGDAIGSVVGSDSFVSNNIFEPIVANPTKSVVGGVAKGMNFAYSYGISRPLSTVLQQQDWGDYVSGDAWRRSWNRSRDISLGQAATVNIDQMAGMGPDWTKEENDPFGDANASNRMDYFHNTNQGQLMSGAFDLVGNIALDPFAVAGKFARTGKAINKAVTGTTNLDRGARVLDAARNTELVPQLDVTPELKKAVEETVGTGQATSGRPILNDQGRLSKPNPLIDEALRRSPSDGPVAFYAYNMPVANLKVGDEISSGHYVQGGLEPHDPRAFIQHEGDDLPTVFKINADAGTPLLKANDVLSDDPNVLLNEDAILAKNTKFKVTNDSQQEITGPDGQPMMARVVEAQVQDSPFKPQYGRDRWGRQISKVFTETDNKTSAEIAQMPQFRNLPDSGALGYFMARANQLYPGGMEYNVTRRHQLKSDILGVAMGDKSAIARIQDKAATLGEEYARMGDTIPAANATLQMRWDKNNQGVLSLFNDRVGEVDQRVAADLQKEQVMYDRLLSNAGPDRSTLFAPTLEGKKVRAPSVISSKMDAYKLKEHTEWRGLGGIPHRMVIGNFQTRVPSSVNIREADRGRDDMVNTLAQVRFMDGKTKKSLTSAFVSARTDSARISAVKAADQVIFETYAKKYGLSPKLASEVIKRIRGHQDTYGSYMASRLYSATDADKTISLYDPFSDMNHVISRPLALSQIEDHVQLLDPRLLDKTMKAVSQNRMLERMAKYLPDTPQGGALKQTASKVHDGAGEAHQVLDQVLGTYTRVWKDAMLFRLAYPLRNQVDNAARMAARLGMLQTMMTLTSSSRGAAKWMLESPDSSRVSVFNLFKGDQTTMASAAEKQLLRKDKYKGVDISPAIAKEDVYRIIGNISSSGGGQADLGRALENHSLGDVRGTGDWSLVEPDQDGWFDAWQRSVRQIGASPTMSTAVGNQNVDALADWVRGNPAARREWLAVSDGYEDIYDWLEHVVSHVNRYLPDDRLKGIITKHSEVVGGAEDNVAKQLRDGSAYDVAQQERDQAATKFNKVTPHYASSQDAHAAAVEEWKDAVKNAQALKGYGKMPKANSFRSKPMAGKTKRTPQQVAADKQRWADAKASHQKNRDSYNAARKRADEALEAKNKAAKKVQGVTSQYRLRKQTLADAEQKTRNVQAFVAQGEMPKDWRSGSFLKAKDLFDNGEIEKMAVHGESFVPNKVNPVDKLMNRVRKNWYQVASDMPETVMGRSPLYRHSFQNYMREAIDNLGPEGITSSQLERIRRGADLSARKEIGKVLYDSSNATNAADALKYVAPFFSAWQDTMTKWAGLIYDNPKAGSLLAQATQAPETAGMIQDDQGNRIDEYGNYYDEDGKLITDAKFKGNGKYIVLPKWAGGSLIPGGGGEFKLNKNNMNILFQGNPPWLPGVGPLVQVPTNEISKRAFPEAVGNNKVLQFVLPYGNTNDSLLDQTITPSWVKQAKDAFGTSDQQANTYMALQAQEYDKWTRGERKTKPTADEIAKMTRNWYLLRAATAFGSPVSITPVPGNQLYLDKAREYRRTKGVTWQDEFYKDFPGYFYSSMSLSQDNTGIQATDKAFDRTKQYRKQINSNPEFGWMYVGADNLSGQFDSNIYAWQQANKTDNGQTFRSHKDPQTALADAQTNMGWIKYEKASTAIELALEERGLRNIQQKGAEDLAAAKQAFVQQLGQENPAWAEAYNVRDSGKMLKFVAAARQAQSEDPSLSKRDDFVALNKYLAARTQVQSLLQSREHKTLDAPENQDLQDAWNGFTQQLKQESIGFGQMYSRVLEYNDDLTRSV